MKIPVDEALRYLRAENAGEDLRRMAEETAAEVEKAVTPRYVWKSFRLQRQPEGVLLPEAGILLPGKLAGEMLADCGTAVLMAVTMGAVFDAMLLAAEARDMAKASVMDVCGSAWAEAGCEEAEKEIADRFPGLYRTDRFSPGYGDLPLEMQDAIVGALNAGRRLGITVNASHLLTPAKSVTAIVGLSERPQKAKIRGCAYCALREGCEYRKRGTACGS